MDRKTRGGGTGRRARKIVNEQEKAAIAIQQRESEVVPAADERLCNLALDTFARAQAVIASCLIPMPCRAARAAMDFSKEEKAEVTQAAQEVLTTHADFVEEHRNAIVLGVAVAAIHVARLDKLMLLAGEDHTPSPRDAVVNLVILFSPLLAFLGLCALMQLLSER
jgi:hypothetical protein